MESFVNNIKLFQEIKWTTTTKTICCCPLALSFVLLHLVLIILEEQTGAIVSDSQACTKIGKDVLLEGGSVVDAAIAIIFCESVLLPSRVGIGGGFSAIIYVGRNIETITATPKVPYGVEGGYINNTVNYTGAADSAVPGTLMGCWQMHRRYGLLAWARLLQPTIELCEKGVPIAHLRQFNPYKQKTIIDNTQARAMNRILETHSNKTDGDNVKFLVLARTLRLIAKEGANIFYNDTIGEDLIRDVQNNGGLLTMADLRHYNVSWSDEPPSFRIRTNVKGYTTPLPTSGAVVALVINVIKNLPDRGSPLFWHKTIEAMKHAYDLSYNLADVENETNQDVVEFVQHVYKKMIDYDFAVYIRELISDRHFNIDLGYYGVRRRLSLKSSSANICILNANGDAIALTSDMLVRDKKAFYSKNTGILLNNQINVFKSASEPEMSLSYNSYLRPGRRLFSAHSPVIVLNKPKSEVSLVVSASGDEMAAAQAITVLVNNFFEGQNAHNSSNSFFFYPDVINRRVLLQTAITGSGLNPNFLKFLLQMGHNIVPMLNAFPFAFRNVIVHKHLKAEAAFTSYQQEGSTDFLDTKSEMYLFLLIIFVGISVFTITVMSFEISKRSRNSTLEQKVPAIVIR